MKTYRYEMKGTSADGQSWETGGILQLDAGRFAEIVEMALKDSVERLASGKAVFSKPGAGGPYEIVRFVVELETEEG